VHPDSRPFLLNGQLHPLFMLVTPDIDERQAVLGSDGVSQKPGHTGKETSAPSETLVDPVADPARSQAQVKAVSFISLFRCDYCLLYLQFVYKTIGSPHHLNCFWMRSV